MELLSNYDENAVTYFAGFAARRCFEKINCKNCCDIMIKTPIDDQTTNAKYIEFREYSNTNEDAPAVTKLIRPTTLFTNIVKIQLKTFSRTWQCYWASSQVLDNIVKECIHATNKIHNGWFDKNDACYDHRIQALKYMITVKIYSCTKYNNRAEKKS